METSDDSSDEVSSKQQQLNKSVCNTGARNVNDDAVFQGNKSKEEQQNYHERQNMSDIEDNSRFLSNEESPLFLNMNEGNIFVASGSTISESTQSKTSSANSGNHTARTSHDKSDQYKEEDDLNKTWKDTNQDEREEEEDKNENKEIEIFTEINKKEKSPPNWHIISEVINRQTGSNPLFHRRFYGSLYAVERLELMYRLNQHGVVTHPGCIVKSLNFNQKGNLLASSICHTVSIWDWALGKGNSFITNNDNITVLQAKWLPLDVESLIVISKEDGQICLLNPEHNNAPRILARNDGKSYQLAVNPEIPYVIFSAGSDSRVLSIDIREKQPNELLVVKENSSNTLLYSIDSNPANNNEFCVSGYSHYVKVYDRRNVSKLLYKLWPKCTENNEYVFVTSVMYNHNGTEILASYNNEKLYLFNKLRRSSPLHKDYAHRYQSGKESALLGINFFGPKSEYIISGSSCNIFIWNKNTEAVIQYMTGDNKGFVHCLESHPHIPVLATSGWDNDIKMWVPSKGKLSKIDFSMTKNILHVDLTLPLLNHYRLENQNQNEDDDDDTHSNDSWLDSSDDSDQSENGDMDIGTVQCPAS